MAAFISSWALPGNIRGVLFCCPETIIEKEKKHGNGRGFAVLAKTDEDVKRFISEYENAGEQTLPELSGKWLDFDTYRRIFISGSYI